MAQSALVELLHRGGLSDAQLARLEHHPAFQFRVGQQHVRRVQLLRALEAGAFTSAHFQAAVAARDADVQRALLDRGALSVAQLDTLARDGATRAVRNIAAARLRRRP
jgi:hypothetical protein